MKKYLLGISGCSGSGKSEIVRQLLQQVDSNLISIISQDNYYKKKETQSIDENGFHNFDLPNSIDKEQFYSDILKLFSGERVDYHEYTYNNSSKKSSKKSIHPNPIIIVEGLFIFYYKKINDLFNSRVFVDAQMKIMIERRIKRDLLERGYDKNDVEYRYNNHVIPSFEKFTLPHKKKSNLIINNDKDLQYSVRELKKFLIKDYNKYKRLLS